MTRGGHHVPPPGPLRVKLTGLETLTARREKLSLNFAKKCTKNKATQWMFPLNTHIIQTRNPEKFRVTRARTERLANSAIPYSPMAIMNIFKHQS